MISVLAYQPASRASSTDLIWFGITLGLLIAGFFTVRFLNEQSRRRPALRSRNRKISWAIGITLVVVVLVRFFARVSEMISQIISNWTQYV